MDDDALRQILLKAQKKQVQEQEKREKKVRRRREAAAGFFAIIFFISLIECIIFFCRHKLDVSAFFFIISGLSALLNILIRPHKTGFHNPWGYF